MTNIVAFRREKRVFSNVLVLTNIVFFNVFVLTNIVIFTDVSFQILVLFLTFLLTPLKIVLKFHFYRCVT